MKQVSVEKVFINFECLGCKKIEQCGVAEATENGAPYCVDCRDTMEMVDCEIDTL